MNVSDDIKRLFLEEFRSGRIPNTEATREVAGVFTIQLTQKPRGRGRPKKTNGGKAERFRARLNNSKRTVEELMRMIWHQLESGASWKATMRKAADEFGFRVDAGGDKVSGVEKRLDEEFNAGSKEKFVRFWEPMARALKSIGTGFREQLGDVTDEELAALPPKTPLSDVKALVQTRRRGGK